MAKLLFDLDLTPDKLTIPLEILNMADICFPELAKQETTLFHLYNAQIHPSKISTNVSDHKAQAFLLMIHYESWSISALTVGMIFKEYAYYAHRLNEVDRLNVPIETILAFTTARIALSHHYLKTLAKLKNQMSRDKPYDPIAINYILASTDDSKIIKYLHSSIASGHLDIIGLYTEFETQEEICKVQDTLGLINKLMELNNPSTININSTIHAGPDSVKFIHAYTRKLESYKGTNPAIVKMDYILKLWMLHRMETIKIK